MRGLHAICTVSIHKPAGWKITKPLNTSQMRIFEIFRGGVAATTERPSSLQLSFSQKMRKITQKKNPRIQVVAWFVATNLQKVRMSFLHWARWWFHFFFHTYLGKISGLKPPTSGAFQVFVVPVNHWLSITAQKTLLRWVLGRTGLLPSAIRCFSHWRGTEKTNQKKKRWKTDGRWKHVDLLKFA